MIWSIGQCTVGRARTVSTTSGSSNRIARLLLLAEPPALDRDEVTDKGSINQRGVLRNRAEAVDQLYAAPLAPVLILPETA